MSLMEEDLLVGTRLRLLDKQAYTAAKENKDLFIMMRRQGLGASDSSVICGVNLFKTREDLLKEKASFIVTPEERAVGEKVNVRKGVDLEPLILQKFTEWTNIQDFDLFKPDAMYGVKGTPLIANFDGVFTLRETLPFIPVEAKFVSTYAHKYYDFSKCIQKIHYGNRCITSGANIKDRIVNTADAIGIPPYYYTQVQQQMYGLESEIGYLAVLDEKNWELHVFKIYQDEKIQNHIVKESTLFWEEVLEERKKKQPS